MIKIGDVKISNPFVLAPMAAINCTSYRLMCKEHGAGLIYTQMIDTDKIIGKTKDEIKKYLNILDIERPVTVQLVGSDIEKLSKTAKLVEEFADIIDINMGCILPDYMERNCGASLLKDLNKIEEVVKAVVNSTYRPVTCKIRIGWDSQSINAVKVAKLLESCGISALAIHGRTAEQKYSGKVNWTIMKQIKNALSIPIIANGDVRSYKDGIDMLEKTGCDMVMVGREAKHAPWVFNKEFVKSNDNVKKELLKFIDYYDKYENRNSINEVREHIFWMFRDFKTKMNPKEIHKLSSILKIRKFVEKC